ncbi:DEAD/DEAH box helicase [Archangium primigenium]|uniref:DEAD/DEAH box helicase n=1 Tax=[Archangium] primigenium TaxID=2792470 RepID=UPI00195A0AE2|nr:DEAD/DEAH box helicase [Archangium primigenium]
MSSSFQSLGLSPESLDAVRRARFASPTPIQAQAIPPALAGRDVIGCAITGTGKTAAYLLPLVERLKATDAGPTGLVLAPTRELVQQIAGEASFFGAPRGLTQAVIIGGTDMAGQVEELRAKPSLLIATPGRLADLLREGRVTLSTVRVLVLDEADRMLEMGFAPELEQVLAALPRERQTLLFSATLGHNVTRFAQETLRRPVKVEVTPSGTPAARAVQRVYDVSSEEKYPLLLTLLAKDQLSTLVFTRTRERAEKVQGYLKNAGYKTALIHSDRTQGQRRQALEGFRRGQYRCMVATDIASRGLDVDDIGHVINFDLPHSPEDYVHRIGRTARAGASGRASSFLTERDEETVVAIERITRMRLPRVEVPRKDAAFREALDAFRARSEEDSLLDALDEPRPERPAKKPARERKPVREGKAPRERKPAREGGFARPESRERAGAAPSRSAGKTRGKRPGTARGEARDAERPSRAPGRRPAAGGKPGGSRGKPGGSRASGGRPGGGKPGGRSGGAPRGAGGASRGRGGGGRRSR